MRSTTAGVFVGAVACMSGFACKPRHESEVSAVKRGFDAESGMDLGKGYDSGRAQSAGECLTGTERVNSQGGGRASYKIETFENFSDVVKDFEISPSLGFSLTIPNTPIAISPKLRLVFGNASKLNRYVGHMLVTSTVQTRTATWSEPAFSRSVGSLRGADNFYSTCGDEYMATRTDGGEFYAMVEIATQTDEQKRKFDADFSSGIAIEALPGKFDIAAKTGRGSTSRNEQKNFTINVERLGGAADGEAKLDSIEQIKAQAERFAATVNADTAVPISGVFASYESVVGNRPAAFDPEAVQQRSARVKAYLDKIGTLGLSYSDVRADLEYILANPDQFEGMAANAAALNTTTGYFEQVVAAIEELQKLTDACRQSLSACKDPAARLPVAEVPPAIKAWSPRRKDASNANPHPQNMSFDVVIDSSPYTAANEICYLQAEIMTPKGKGVVVATSAMTRDTCAPGKVLKVTASEAQVRGISPGAPKIRLRVLRKNSMFFSPTEVMRYFVEVNVLTEAAKTLKRDQNLAPGTTQFTLPPPGRKPFATFSDLPNAHGHVTVFYSLPE